MYMKTIRITTQLGASLVQLIDIYAKKRKNSKRAIIEDALYQYFQKLQHNDLLAGYNAMGNDPIEMNEWLTIANNQENLQI